jgi:hypothetical protein
MFEYDGIAIRSGMITTTSDPIKGRALEGPHCDPSRDDDDWPGSWASCRGNDDRFRWRTRGTTVCLGSAWDDRQKIPEVAAGV